MKHYKNGLIKPPILRSGVEKERERHATWLELLYDLVFVAAISQLSVNLNKDYSFFGFLNFSILFIPVWWAWIGHTFYLTRFDSDDVIHRLLTMVQIVAVASLIVHVPSALGESTNGFALSYAAVRSMLVLEYWRAGRHNRPVRPLVNRYMIGFGCAAALWVVSTFIPMPHRFIVWYLAIGVDFFAPLTAGALHVKFPPHLVHLPERFGLFTIIVIGEAVVSIVMGIKAGHLISSSAAAAIMGLIIVFTLWWGYFDGVKGAGTRQLTSKDHVRAYQQWLYSHLPLTMAIASIAVGIRRVMALPASEMLPFQESWILSASIGICMLSLNTIFLSSYPGRPPDEALRFVCPHYALAFLACVVGGLGTIISGIAVLGILTALSVLLILFSLRYLPE
ncbi:MAG: low temperature requirement protein A [Deltaproteobacteria bacterium]|nr:low temperature requirement protein A [Deltaproteobacteria bacterium]